MVGLLFGPLTQFPPRESCDHVIDSWHHLTFLLWRVIPWRPLCGNCHFGSGTIPLRLVGSTVFSRQMFWYSKSETPPCSRQQQKVFSFTRVLGVWTFYGQVCRAPTLPWQHGASALAHLMACNWGSFGFRLTWRILTFYSSTVYALFVEDQRFFILLRFFFIPIIQTKEGLLAHRRTFINAIFTTIALRVHFHFLL